MSLAALRASGGTFITIEATFSGSYIVFSLTGQGVAVIDWGDDAPDQTFELSDFSLEELDTYSDDEIEELMIGHNVECGVAQKITVAGNITGICMGIDLHISALDTGNMPQLNCFMCREAGLSTLDVSKNTNLKFLYVEDNAFTELDISKNRMLQYLDCSNNRLEHAELIDIFTALPDREEIDNATIVCGGNPGYDAITNADKSILTKKKWYLLEIFD